MHRAGRLISIACVISMIWSAGSRVYAAEASSSQCYEYYTRTSGGGSIVPGSVSFNPVQSAQAWLDWYDTNNPTPHTLYGLAVNSHSGTLTGFYYAGTTPGGQQAIAYWSLSRQTGTCPVQQKCNQCDRITEGNPIDPATGNKGDVLS